MKLFRTLSTGRLVALLAGVLAAVVVVGVAVASTGGSGGPTPPAEPLATALHDALTAPKPSGVSAQITFTNSLFPSGALTGQTGSALMSGASGRLWANANGARLELQSDSGDTQVVWYGGKLSVYDASSNNAYELTLPQAPAGSGTTATGAPSLDQITTFLSDLGSHWNVSGAQPGDLANGQPAYTVSISPSHDGGLLGSAELAWDATNGVPLKVAVYAQGSTSPALALEVNNISFASVPDSDIDIAPPAGANVIDLTSLLSPAGSQSAGSATPPVVGLSAVQAAAPWATVPGTLVGLPLQDVRLVGPSDSRAAVAVYGQGLGAIVVVEHQTSSSSGSPSGTGPLSALPSVQLSGGVTAHELSTQLGTVLGWQNAGVSTILAGSVPTVSAETAARALQ